MERDKDTQHPYIKEPLTKIDKRLFLLVLLGTLGITFALWEFPVYSLAPIIAILFLAGVYNVPELGIGFLVNGLNLIGYFVQGIELSHLVIPAIVILYTPALAHYVLNHGLKWKFGVVPGLVIFVGVMMFIGILYSPLPSQGFTKAGKYLTTNFFIFFATSLFIEDIDRLKNLLKIVSCFGFVTATISIIYIAYTWTGGIFRFALPSQNPIWFARDLGISLLATLCLFEISKKKKEKLIYMSFVLVMLFLIYVAGSRGPFGALLVSFLLYLFLSPGKGFNFSKKLFFIFLTLFALKISIAIAPEHIWNRMLNLFSKFDVTTLYRLHAFETAKNLFFNNLLGGVGTAGFGYFHTFSYPHNIFLELASELGILGVLAFTILIFYGAYLGIKLLRNEKASFLESNLNKTFFAIFVFTFINSQVSGAVYGNYQLWFSIAGIWTLYCSQLEYLQTE